MVRLTVELIQSAAQYTNPVRERELDLRGYKIPTIENLGASLNQFDMIDFSDNEIRKIDNFPYLPRLKSLLFNNNRIVRIAEGLEENLPHLETLVLTNNNIQELADIEPLATVKTITMLSFLHNAVMSKPNYRLFVIHKFPNLRLLDFRRVKDKERAEAKALFKSKKGKEQLQEIEKKAKTFVPGAPLPGAAAVPARPAGGHGAGLTLQQVREIKAAIAKATTLEEIDRLSKMLRAGQVGGVTGNGNAAANGNGNPVEEMDED